MRRIIYYGSIPKYEPEVIRFLTAISVPNDSTIYFPSTAYEITGSELWEALNICTEAKKTAVGLPLKVDNLSTKWEYIYPRIGGTSTAHRYNLVTGTADGTYNGGFTHDGSGAVGNGSTGYFQTGFNLNTFSQNDLSFGVIIKTNVANGSVDLSMFGGGTGDLLIQGRTAGGNLTTRLANSDGNKTTTIGNSDNIIFISRQSSTEFKIYDDGSLLDTKTSTSATLGTYEVVEFALNTTGSINLYTTRKHTWSLGGSGFSATQIGDINTALATFETTLNR